jgi:lipopolysaccharide/colanic/teichoic acid biosynthesis glycosyltransferase
MTPAVVRGGQEVLVRDRDRRGYLIAKRLFDLAVCFAAVPVVVPLLGLIALAIRLDSPGPIVFRQQRTGRHGVRFGMYKFRTMVRNAEELKASLAHLNILPPPDFKIPDDPRITRVGKILRKTSLDELPQILNVVRGEMSLVGPRPTSFAPSTYSRWHTARLEVTPVITGLWQVFGRNEMSFDERLRLDIEYIRTRSLWLDLKILFWTIGSVITRPGE